MTKTYQFDSKRDAQQRFPVGGKVWADADGKDHRQPDSLLIVVAAEVRYNASGPREWAKDVTFRVATREEWAAARAREIETKLLPRLSACAKWDMPAGQIGRLERESRAEWTDLKAELATLREVTQ